ALRAGAGLVSVATRAAHAAALTAAQPELMCRGVERAEQLKPLIERADVIAVGPGLGQDEWGWMVCGEAFAAGKPLVVDADALNLLAHSPRRNDGWVLTPHPGEAARLLGITAAAVQADRVAAARALRERYGGVALLKGPGTLVQGEVLALCPYGNAGMAVGGMGDALTGIIAAFIAQGQTPETAACAGALAHAIAGDRAARDGERGLMPTDLVGELRGVVNP
ncbi:MAG: NAD(P)H-hydrate dehydratase, partial [Nevskia sp.]|nr:NAD(P)H-hydrate dehydratase [Nevskia sp.]